MTLNGPSFSLVVNNQLIKLFILVLADLRDDQIAQNEKPLTQILI